MTATLQRHVHKTTDSVAAHDGNTGAPFSDEISSMNVSLSSQEIEGATRKVERGAVV